MKETSITLFTARIILGSIFIAASAFAIQNRLSLRVEWLPDQETILILSYHNSISGNAEDIPTPSGMQFFLKRTDLHISPINFNLIRRLEGYYECGKRVNSTSTLVIESSSPPKIHIDLCKYYSRIS